MNYEIIYSNTFRKSLKRCQKRGLDVEKLRTVLEILVEGRTLPAKYKQHKLTGKFKGAWECHIEPDWLLVWEVDDNKLVLLLVDTGSHADLFG